MKKGNIRPLWNDIAFFVLPRQLSHLGEHILNENAVSCGGIVYENVGYRSDELTVLYDGRARHECGQ